MTIARGAGEGLKAKPNMVFDMFFNSVTSDCDCGLTHTLHCISGLSSIKRSHLPTDDFAHTGRNGAILSPYSCSKTISSDGISEIIETVCPCLDDVSKNVIIASDAPEVGLLSRVPLMSQNTLFLTGFCAL